MGPDRTADAETDGSAASYLSTNRVLHVVIAMVPLVLSPLVLFSLAEGWVDLGGGEKDVLFVIPYLIGSLTFSICGLVLVAKRWPLARWVKRSIAVSVGLLLGLAMVAFVTSWLGIG